MKPCPSSPIRLVSGTRTLSYTNSAVSLDQLPIFSSFLLTEKPGVSVGTMISDMPLNDFPGVVRTSRQTQSACTPLVMNSLLPLIT